MVERIAKASKVSVINTHTVLEMGMRIDNFQGKVSLWWVLLACWPSRRNPCT